MNTPEFCILTDPGRKGGGGILAYRNVAYIAGAYGRISRGSNHASIQVMLLFKTLIFSTLKGKLRQKSKFHQL